MNILIVEGQTELGMVWSRHLERFGGKVVLASNQREASAALLEHSFRTIVLDLDLAGGGALALADLASYRQPEARIIFVTNTSFFSDGSIFRHCANARAYVPAHMPPEDLAAIVEHYSQIA